MYIEALEARIAPALVFAVRGDQHLISFDLAEPGAILSDVAISSPPHSNEAIDGIAFRPANGLLYAFGKTTDGAGYIYTLNTSTGTLTEVGSTAFTMGLSTSDIGNGFSFDPVADVLRVVDTFGDNFRVNANTGALIAQDTALHDPATNSQQVYGVAYDRNYTGAGATTLYGLEFASDTLVRIGDLNGLPASANGGVVTHIGSYGVTSSSRVGGFAIQSRTGTAFAAIDGGAASATDLYTINLTTGAGTIDGPVGDGTQLVLGLAVALPPSDLKIVNDQLATYTDTDGDLVTVKTTGHGLNAADFHFATGAVGSQLIELDLSGIGLAGTGLTITARPGPHGGDGSVNVGTIQAPGLPLGRVTVGGDLGSISAGDGIDSMVALTVHSFGKLGVSTQDPAHSGLVSDLNGRFGTLAVKTDFAGENFNVDSAISGAGTIGAVVIGGDLLGANDGSSSARLFSDSAIGNVTIGGSIVGGTANDDGSIFSEGSLGNLTIGGSILGGTQLFTGWVESDGNMGAVKIGHDVVGGAGAAGYSGGVVAKANLGSVTIGGSIVGGVGPNAGFIGIEVSATGHTGPVKIGGSLLGSGGRISGSVYSAGSLGSVTVGGSLRGGAGAASGSIVAGTGIGQITVRGDVTAGSASEAGSIDLYGTGHVAGVTIGGSLVGASGTSNGLILHGAGDTLGAVFIGGEIRADSPGGLTILASGTPGSTTPAIASVTVKGSVRDALIVAGVVVAGTGSANPAAAIGAVTVGGNWIASSIGAGVSGVGNDSDVRASESTPETILSSIKSVTIAGYVQGTVGGSDGFGIEAEQIGTVKVGTRTYTVAPGTDKIGFALGTTSDVRLREVDTTATTIPAPPGSTPDQLAFTNTATAHTATFLDEDGDLVTIAITGAPAGATLGAGDLSLTSGPYGSHLAGLDLSDATYGQAWKGASVSITAKPQGALGDSFVNVGYLNATGVDLGNVTIHGDLGQIDAGDSQIGNLSLGLKSLTVQSLGFFGTSGQITQGASTESDIRGSMATLTIKTDLAHATVKLTGSSELTTASIGGDIIGDATNPESLTVAGGLSVENDITSLTIGGSLLGGAVADSGLATTTFGDIAKLTIGGSIFGGTASQSGGIDTLGLGPVAIRGDVIGGTSDHTGYVHAAGNIASVALGGSIIGQNTGGESDSGLIYTLSGATDNIGPVTIGGSLLGSDTRFSGSFYSSGALASVTVAGSLVGAAGYGSGRVTANLNLGNVKIGGDLRGGAGPYSGSITTFGDGSIGNVAIGGSLVGRAGEVTGILSAGHLGAVTIGGGIRGADPPSICASRPRATRAWPPASRVSP